MKVSVIIVNYNVKYFLEICLQSVCYAAHNFDVEVIVVDNQSSDGSLSYLIPKFPTVHFIAAETNLGFGKASNLGLSKATGDYILFLNPDTIIPPDTFSKAEAFFNTHIQSGAIGVRMIDGNGQFLKESKRSFPSPLTSLYKLFGLATLFPHSKTFSKYHLGYLSEFENHEVDVLSGAFMMIKKSVLDVTGGFDELFFMYGEDIDLSYRIQKQGYKNYYVAAITIVHFKGESTSKGSLNYIKMFYQAMSLFVQKHYQGSKKRRLTFFLHIAIWFRAILTVMSNFIKKISLPVFDFVLLLLSFFAVQLAWNDWVNTSAVFNDAVSFAVFTGVSAIYIGTLWFLGVYDRKSVKLSTAILGIVISIMLAFSIYSVLPMNFRFSRSIFFIGSAVGYLIVYGYKFIFNQLGIIKFAFINETNKQVVILGNQKSITPAKDLLKNNSTIIITDTLFIDNGFNQQKINESYRTTAFEELIIGVDDKIWNLLFPVIQNLPVKVRFSFFIPHEQIIIGSDDKNIAGDINKINQDYNLSKPWLQKTKRVVDVVFALIFLILIPIQIFFKPHFKDFIKNCFLVLIKKRTWVGLSSSLTGFKDIKQGVIDVTGKKINTCKNHKNDNVDLGYLQTYHWYTDIFIILKYYKQL